MNSAGLNLCFPEVIASRSEEAHVECGRESNMVEDLFESAVQDESAGDFRSAMRKYMDCVSKGYHPANAAIGLLYRHGRGVLSDKRLALQWFERGMTKNDPRSITLYASMLDKGEGTERNRERALDLYERAIELGDSWALTNVARLYRDGEVVPQDYSIALEYYSRAAGLGDSMAMLAIGGIYEEGFGVPKSRRRALEWFIKASAEGDGSAAGRAERRIGALYHRGVDGPPEYALAASWYRKGAKHPDALCHWNLGELHYFGRLGSKPNWEEALRHYEAAAGLGLAKGNYDAALTCLKMPAGVRDANKIVRLLETAASEGIVKAYTKLGVLYDAGDLVPRDRRKSMELYRKASALGDGWASRNIGLNYRDGTGVWFRNYKKAMEYFRKGAQQGNADAIYQVGSLYAQGKGVRENEVLALEWINKAAEKGSERAKQVLDRLYSGRSSRSDNSSNSETNEYLERLEARVEELEAGGENDGGDGRRRRVNSKTGEMEVDSFFGWVADTDGEGRRHRINPTTGVIEEDSWLGWVPKR